MTKSLKEIAGNAAEVPWDATASWQVESRKQKVEK
jgi:hypothetical protein